MTRDLPDLADDVDHLDDPPAVRGEWNSNLLLRHPDPSCLERIVDIERWKKEVKWCPTSTNRRRRIEAWIHCCQRGRLHSVHLHIEDNKYVILVDDRAYDPSMSIRKWDDEGTFNITSWIPRLGRTIHDLIPYLHDDLVRPFLRHNL